MRDYSRQAELALAVYRDRGRRALKLLQGGDIDGADEVLRLRTAAFHNFRVADALAQKQGHDLSQNATLQKLWSDIQNLEVLLTSALSEAYQKTGRIYMKIREARSKLGHYRSREEDVSRFEQSV